MTDDAAVARSQRLLDQVKEGKTIFFKAGGGWDIIGPAADIEPGQTVTVTKAAGDTTEVIVVKVMAERTVHGVATRTATFRNPAAAAAAPAHVDPPRPAYNVVDRQAAAVGGMLGRDSSTARGYCHHCGLELDRNGNCDECV
ncbi:hypothetical protein [Asanoa siamensis]|uniref:Uncharacterized protein n=1 Tax=Asanoa siamensis TaxID=926357 RepID=A0ABQ4CXF1_9ACTN|nr:hypothetical protein [Asanoa siamensis]GIF75683.1 hypothetical protein Asi02nite_52010 [Asanoa siamensis]